MNFLSCRVQSKLEFKVHLELISQDCRDRHLPMSVVLAAHEVVVQTDNPADKRAHLYTPLEDEKFGLKNF